MFKQIITLATVFFLIISCKENFENIPEEYTTKNFLLKQIKPSSKIEYWQIDYISLLTPNKIYSEGNQNLLKNIPFPENIKLGGFFTGCQPLQCNYRISYIENNKWNFVQDKSELEKFIGKIDNEFEAFLIAIINGYSIDSKPQGNGFVKTNNGYKLKVMLYNNCPETKKSFIVSVDKNGKLNIMKDLGYYSQKKDCIKY